MRKVAAKALVPIAIAGAYGTTSDHMAGQHWQHGLLRCPGLIALARLSLHRPFERNDWM